MRERAGLRRAAWREQWPAATMAIAIAIATWAWTLSIGDELPAPAWLVLALLPAAMFAGLAVGHSPSRMLVFLLARPCSRSRLMAARIEVALGSLAIATAIVALPVLVRTPDGGVAIEVVLAAAVLVLAFACGVIGALATDREPLALGAGVLLFCWMPTVLLVVPEPLGITPLRVVAAHPFGVLAAILIAIAACAGAARRFWCERLPVRDKPAVKQLLLATAVGWIAAQLICAGLSWRSAAADESQPMVVLGDGAHGLVVAAGTFGTHVDAVLAGEAVMLDATVRSGRSRFYFYDVTRAVTDGEHVAVTLGPGTLCRVVLFDPHHGERELEEDWRELGRRPMACGRLMLSPSGATLAIVRGDEIVRVDTETAVTSALESVPYIVVVGWLGEELVVHGKKSDQRLRVGDRVLSELPVRSASISPDQRRVAVRIQGDDAADGSALYDRGPTEVAVLDLTNGGSTRFELPITESRIVGWLDDEHIVLNGRNLGGGAASMIAEVGSGAVIQRLDAEQSMWTSRIEGPPHGPWLVTRGTMVDAIAPDGALLWRENVGTLERDEPDVHRWAIVDGEAVGIDRSGRWWHRPVPWEVSQ